MADAKIINYGQPIGAGTTVIPDNQVVALDIESTDGKEFVRVISTDSGERVVLGEGTGVAGEGIPVVIGPGDAGGNEFTVGNGSGQEIEFDIGGTNVIKSQAATNFQIGTHAAHTLQLMTANTARLHVSATGKVAAGSAASIKDKVFEANNGTQYFSVDVGGGDSYVVCNSTQVKYYGGSDANHALSLNKYGALARWSLGSTDAAIANDATGDVDANSAAYLADSGATLIVDFAKGGCGQLTLTANVTAIKFYNTPKLGIAQTMTVKITNDDPARTVVYSSVTISDGAPGTTRNGSLLWSGGVAPTLSTGVGDIDIVQFTCIATSDTDRDIYGAVIGQNFS